MVEVMNGPEDGREIVCDRLPITIGRSGENSIGLSCDHLISRYHATIEKSEEGFVLKDLKSTNGTFIEDKKVRKSTPIEPDQLFRVGATLLRMKKRLPKKSSG
jgi:pSer/pThr/pTyr-binding forkhead associated (FHA) protein